MVQKSNTGSRAHYDPENALLATSGHLISDILLQKTTFTIRDATEWYQITSIWWNSNKMFRAIHSYLSDNMK